MLIIMLNGFRLRRAQAELALEQTAQVERRGLAALQVRGKLVATAHRERQEQAGPVKVVAMEQVVLQERQELENREAMGLQGRVALRGLPAMVLQEPPELRVLTVLTEPRERPEQVEPLARLGLDCRIKERG